MKYSELLKDGRWQVRKNEIMSRDGFRCRKCGASALDGVTLNVHHIRYYRGRKPWEYADKDLVTLCESCHKHQHSDVGLQDMGIRLGDMVRYQHSDYDNYGIIYDINPVTLTAKIATVDDGGDNSCLVLDEVNIHEDKSLWINNYYPVMIEACFDFDFDENYFWGCVAECVARLEGNHQMHNYDSFYCGNGVYDIPAEFDTFVANLPAILANNEKLKDYLNSNDAL